MCSAACVRAERPRTNPCAASWTGIQVEDLVQDPALDLLQPRLRALDHARRAGRPRQVRVACSCAGARRRHAARARARRRATRAGRVELERSASAPTVSIRGTGHGARTIAGWKIGSCSTRGASRPPRHAPRARSRCRRRARAGGPAAGAGRPRAPRRRRRAATPGDRPPAAPAAAIASGSHSPARKAAARTRPSSRRPIKACDDAARRLSSCVRSAVRGAAAGRTRCAA